MKNKTGYVVLSALAGKVLVKIMPTLGKFFKVGLAGVSMASYTYIFTWEFAAMIMVMLFVHESGHIWAMKRCGMKTKGIYFLPFFGGAAIADDEFPSHRAEVFIAIMGPICGFVLALLTGITYIVTENPLFAAAASWMAMVTLVDLLPINPLDGGRIMKSILYSVQSRVAVVFLGIGTIASGLLAFKVGLEFLLLLSLFSGAELIWEYKKRRTELLKMDGATILVSAIAYVSIVGALWWLMSYMKHIPGAAAAMELLKG